MVCFSLLWNIRCPFLMLPFSAFLTLCFFLLWSTRCPFLMLPFSASLTPCLLFFRIEGSPLVTSSFWSFLQNSSFCSIFSEALFRHMRCFQISLGTCFFSSLIVALRTCIPSQAFWCSTSFSSVVSPALFLLWASRTFRQAASSSSWLIRGLPPFPCNYWFLVNCWR